jgi:2-dehydro-3-deoxyphosphogluconate aldolase/(4S)-4-hydroxy-2-oxoglutarate aldolase
MDRDEVLTRISEVGVVPVVRAASAMEAIQVVEAIRAGGLNILEITMTVPGAVKVIEEVANRYWIRKLPVPASARELASLSVLL